MFALHYQKNASKGLSRSVCLPLILWLQICWTHTTTRGWHFSLFARNAGFRGQTNPAWERASEASDRPSGSVVSIPKSFRLCLPTLFPRPHIHLSFRDPPLFPFPPPEVAGGLSGPLVWMTDKTLTPLNNQGEKKGDFCSYFESVRKYKRKTKSTWAT